MAASNRIVILVPGAIGIVTRSRLKHVSLSNAEETYGTCLLLDTDNSTTMGHLCISRLDMYCHSSSDRDAYQ